MYENRLVTSQDAQYNELLLVATTDILDNHIDSIQKHINNIKRITLARGLKEYSVDDLGEFEEAFVKLGDLYQKSGAYTHAAALYNTALNAQAKKCSHLSETTSNFAKRIRNKLTDLEKTFLQQILTSPCELSYESHQETIDKYRRELHQIREDIKLQLSTLPQQSIQTKTSHENEIDFIRQIYIQLHNKLRDYIKSLLGDCYKTLGNSPCKFAIVGLGSFARKEMTPYSDLEFMILLEEGQDTDKNKDYFRHLTNLLHLKVINLGETILPAMAIDALNPAYRPADWIFFDDINRRGFAFDGAMPQACKTPLGKKDADSNSIFELIQTPSNMAAFHGEHPDGGYWFKKEEHLTSALMNTALIDGDNSLLEQYVQAMNAKLDLMYDTKFKLREYLANRLIHENLQLFNPHLTELEYEGKLHDVKKDIYRIPTIFLDQLALFYRIDSSDNWTRLEILGRKKLIKNEGALSLQRVLTQALYFRLLTYFAYDAQTNQLNPLIRSANIDTSLITLHHFTPTLIGIQNLEESYKVITPFMQAMQAFYEGNILPLRTDHFYDESLLTQARIHIRLSNYVEAKKYYKRLYQEQRDNLEISNEFGKLLLRLRKNEKATIYFKKVYNALSNDYKAKLDLYADCLKNLATADCGKNVNQALEYLSSAEKLLQNMSGCELKLAEIFNVYGEIYRTHGGEIQKSIGYFQKAYDINEKLLGFNHPKVIMDLHNLACAWFARGSKEKGSAFYEASFKYATDALNKGIKIFNYRHPFIATILSSLGEVFRNQDKFEEAYKYYELALAIDKCFIEENPGSVARDLNNFGMGYLSQGVLQNSQDHFAKAEYYFQEALPLVKQVYGETDFRYALVLNNLATIATKKGEYQSSIDNFNTALIIQKRINNVPEIIKCLSNIGRVYKFMQNYEEALNHSKEALTVLNQNQVAKWNNPLRAQVHTNLGIIYAEIKEYESALDHYKTAKDMYITITNQQDNIYSKNISIEIDKIENEMQQGIAPTNLNFI